MFLDEFIEIFAPSKKPKPALSHWIKYDWNDFDSHPKNCGHYIVSRKDGKIHWEHWNGNGFAYNSNVIRYWAEIIKPQ